MVLITLVVGFVSLINKYGLGASILFDFECLKKKTHAA